MISADFLVNAAGGLFSVLHSELGNLEARNPELE
jgi:hypothetical protein